MQSPVNLSTHTNQPSHTITPTLKNPSSPKTPLTQENLLPPPNKHTNAEDRQRREGVGGWVGGSSCGGHSACVKKKSRWLKLKNTVKVVGDLWHFIYLFEESRVIFDIAHSKQPKNTVRGVQIISTEIAILKLIEFLIFVTYLH